MPNKLPRAVLARQPTTDQGTFGVLLAAGLAVGLLELPWRNNKRQLSCIPEGEYLCRWIKSPRFGWVYTVCDVPGRGNILIHPGNFAGDSTLGFKTNSHGCLLPHTRRGRISGQAAGLLSGPAVRKIVQYFNKQDFILEVKNA